MLLLRVRNMGPIYNISIEGATISEEDRQLASLSSIFKFIIYD